MRKWSLGLCRSTHRVGFTGLAAFFGLVVRPTCQIPSISPPGPAITIASSSLPKVSIFRRHWKPVHWLMSSLLDAIWTMRRATLQYGQSAESVESRRGSERMNYMALSLPS